MSVAARVEALLARHWWQPRTTPAMRALLPLSYLYALLATLAGRRRAQRAPVPVLVVGNLVVGGAGKTPTVIALVQALQQAGWQPGVISRGHGRSGDAPLAVAPSSSAAQAGDEPLLIARRTGVPVWVGRRRIAAARALCAANPVVDILISDDGLQHAALAREAEIVVFDERGAGNGRLLPAGPLREPLPRRLPPRRRLLYNAPQPSTPLPGALALRSPGPALPLADWWAGRGERAVALDALRGPRWLAVAGVAAPERFFAMLEAAGLAIERLPLPDHHAYASLPWPADAERVLTTEKDAVKLEPSRLGGTQVWVVGLDFRLPPDFTQALLAELGPPRTR
jgi:tetraacyldisaccharide 4'-kinase